MNHILCRISTAFAIARATCSAVVSWSRDVIDVAAGASTLAGAAPLLGVNLINDEQWWTWVREQPVTNPFVRSWLIPR